jgi:hypothetical protein
MGLIYFKSGVDDMPVAINPSMVSYVRPSRHNPTKTQIVFGAGDGGEALVNEEYLSVIRKLEGAGDPPLFQFGGAED